MSVTRYSNLLSGERVERKSLSKLGMDSQYFSAACYRREIIYTTGGRGRMGSNAVAKYDITLDNWSIHSVLKVPRQCHASCILGDTLYVIGGENKTGSLNSIESLSLIQPLNATADNKPHP